MSNLTQEEEEALINKHGFEHHSDFVPDSILMELDPSEVRCYKLDLTFVEYAKLKIRCIRDNIANMYKTQPTSRNSSWEARLGYLLKAIERTEQSIL
jgi:hypothetical protein